MADSVSESYIQTDSFSIQQISNSLLGIPGFLVGRSSKGSFDLDSVQSPTSLLDFRVVNLINPFSVKSPRSSSQNGYPKKWDCSKVGLGIINFLAEENKSSGEVPNLLKRKNSVLGLQVKANIHNSLRCCHESVNSFTKYNSLPQNCMSSTLSQAKTPNFPFRSSHGVLENGELPLEPEPFSSSLISSAPKQNSSSKTFCSVDRTINMSAPVVIDRGLLVDNSLKHKPCSLPTSMGPGHGHTGSLSTHEIELSEDYTCIISHGPNAKTTHIFGDYVLECQTHEMAAFDEKAEQGVELPQVTDSPKSLIHYPSDEFLSFFYSCKKKLDNGEDIYMYRGEKACCSFDCRSEQLIFAKEEIEKAYESSESSPESSYHEDLFLMGVPAT